MRSGARVGVLSVLVGVALGLAGCKAADNQPPSNGLCCVADPAPHKVNLFDCADDMDCPSGSVCVAAPDSDAGWPISHGPPPPMLDKCGGDAGGRRCELPPTRSSARQALTTGFHVKAFELRPLPGDGSVDRVAFTWAPPTDASIVHCALFACRPVIRTRSIANFDSCVLADELFDSGSGVFDLANPDLEFHPRDLTDDEENDCRSTGPRRISELAVGCWAYDTTHIIAATPMLSITGKGIYNYQDAFADACSPEMEGKSCLVSASGRLGACHAGDCRELCVDNSDCDHGTVVVTGSDGGGGADGSSQDAGSTPDGSSQDAGSTPDASSQDAGNTPDALAPDAAADSSVSADAAANGQGHPVVPPPYCLKDSQSYIGVCMPTTDAGP